MKTKRSPWTLLVWPASLLAILALIWISGYVYWQIRINREIVDLRRDTAARLIARNPPSELLHRAGSRAFRPLLEEMNDALQRNDRELANLLFRVSNDTWACSLQPSMDITLGWASTSTDCALDYLRAVAKRDEALWESERKNYPPWWMWWRGSRRTP